MAGFIGYIVGQSIIFALIGFAVGKLAAEGTTKLTMSIGYKTAAFFVCWLIISIFKAISFEFIPAHAAGFIDIVVALIIGATVSFAFLKWRGTTKIAEATSE